MQNNELPTKEIIETEMAHLLQVLTSQRDDKVFSEIEPERLQELFSALIKIYVNKVQNQGSNFSPITKGKITQTDTMIFADQLLKSMEIELFELQMWRSMGSNY